MDTWEIVFDNLKSGKSLTVSRGDKPLNVNFYETIEVDDTLNVLNKWKQLADEGQPPYDIHIPGYGTFTNCEVIPGIDSYTINYDEYKKDV